MSTEAPRFHFGPPERKGFVAGLTFGQVILLAAALGLAVCMIRLSPTVHGFTAASLVLAQAALICFFKVEGRTLQQWLPVAAGWAVTVARRQHRYRTAMPLLGQVDGISTPAPPATLAGVRILAQTMETGEEVGVLHDRHRQTYSLVLRVRGRSFELADEHDKLRRIDAWGMVLASLGREHAHIHRLQLVERTVDDDGHDVRQHAASFARLPAEHPAAQSYAQLIDAAGPASQPHETFMVISVSAARSRRAIKASGAGDRGAIALLTRETRHLARQLQGAEVTAEGALDARGIAEMLRVAFDPPARVHLARRAAGSGEQPGTTEANAWPLGTHTSWGAYRSEGVWHATYHVAQFPRLPVGPDFLAHLLLGTTSTRTISLTMEPIPASRAHREVEKDLLQSIADDELRARAGFMGTARRRREREAVSRREEELAAGHTDYRMSGYVTVTAATPDELETSCAEVEQAAERCRLELRRLYGQQDIAFTWTLPLGRGLA